MLKPLPGPILLDFAILLTSFCWGMGFYIADRRLRIFAPLAIGGFVCLTGYSAESLGAPIWLVVAAPIPLDFVLLWYVMRRPRPMLIAYASTWAIYLVVHVAISALFRYDFLIPAWKLHS